MNHTSPLVAILSLLTSSVLHSAEPPQSLAQDAARLSSGKGTTFESAVLDVQFKNGSHSKQVLVMEFSPLPPDAPANPNPPDATVKLLLASPKQGVKGVAEVSVSVGVSNRDVRLQEKDGVRTITMTRSPATIDHPNAKTERILATFYSCSFGYVLNGDTLTLKGFSKEGTKWGNLEFTVPAGEVTFKAVK